MRVAVYNSGIPQINVNRTVGAPRLAHFARLAAILPFLLLGLAISAGAADWNEPEQQLARKIVAVTGPGVAAISFENRSSLGKRDSEIVQNGLRSELERAGLRQVSAEQAAATISIVLSENATSYVWVAQVRQGAADAAVVMVSTPRLADAAAAHESVPLTLRKVSLWSQEAPILDAAVLEEDNGTATHIAVLDAEKVGIYRSQAGRWMQEQSLAIAHSRPWPRDLRGRLIPGRDHLLDVYLPGVMCRSTTSPPLNLNCRESDDPWPLVPAGVGGSAFAGSPASSTYGLATIPTTNAFYAANRNFFTGALTAGIGKIKTVPKFYSAAFLPRDKYVLWLFAATDDRVHEIDGMNDQIARFDWGSDVASVKTACGAGWQVLATSAGPASREGTGDSIRAYEFPDRDPAAVSAAVEFSGAVTALWTEARGDTAIAVAKNRETGNYEAFRLAVVCSQ